MLTDVMYELSHQLSQMTAAIVQMVRTVVVTLKNIAVTSARFTAGVFEAHHYLFGKYTCPPTNAPPLGIPDYGLLGQAALTIGLVIPLAWVASLTLTPLLSNSTESFIFSCKLLVKLALIENDFSKIKSLSNHNFIQNFNSISGVIRNIYGIPGLLFGSLAGLGVGGLIVMGRFIVNHIKTAIYFAAQLSNLVVPDSYKDILNISFDRSTAAKILGLPGYLTGIPLGLVGILTVSAIRIMYESYYSFVYQNKIISNYALADADQRTPDKPHTFARYYRLGMPGLLLGTVVGIGLAVLFGIARMTGHSALSAFSILGVIANLTVLRDKKIPVEKINYHQFLGIPGYLLAIPLTIVVIPTIALGRIVYYSFLNTIDLFKRISNLALPTNRSFTPEAQQPHWFKHYLVGLPGLILGSIMGLTSATLISAGRIVSNSWKNGTFTFAWLSNKALSDLKEAQRLEEQYPVRLLQVVLGLPGFLLGILPGVIGFGSILVGRSAYESVFSAIYQATVMSNYVLHEKDQWPLNEKNTSFRHNVLGFPGLVLGSVIGLGLMALLGLGRIGTNSAKSARYIWATITNLALTDYKPEERLPINRKNLRSTNEKLMGTLGYLIGMPLGLISFAAVAVARVIYESWLNIVTLSKAAYHIASEQNVTIEPRHWFKRFIMGFPGLIFGSVAGLATIAITGMGRIVLNSSRLAVFMFASLCNLALFDCRKIDLNGSMTVSQKILGTPGLFLGLLPGIAGFVSIIAFRTLVESTNQCRRQTMTVANLVLAKEDKKLPLNLAPGDWKYSVMRLPGGLLGTVLGLGAIPVIIVGRIVTNSVQSIKFTWIKLVNLALFGCDDSDKINAKEDKRGLLQQMMGVPGRFIGAGLGIASALIVLTARFVSQNFKSWWALSASIINGSVQRPIFYGLRGDKRNGIRKATGTLGYISACFTTLPIGMVIFGLRKAPFVLLGAFAILAFLLIAPCKLMAIPFQQIRYRPLNIISNQEKSTLVDIQSNPSEGTDESNTSDEENYTNSGDTAEKLIINAIRQKFADLRSSLSATGEFTSDHIKSAKTNRESVGRFFHKSITLNIKTVEEHTLDALEAAYLEGNGKLSKGSIQQAKESVMRRYPTGWFMSDIEHDNYRQRMENVIKITNQYLRSNFSYISQENLSKNKKTPSWFSLFKGKQNPNNNLPVNDKPPANQEGEYEPIEQSA